MTLTFRSVGVDGEPWPTWVRELKGKSGAYAIKGHGCDGAVHYVGSAGGDLYDTLTRHYQQWKRKKNFWKGMRGAGHDPGLTYRRSTSCVAVMLTAKGAHREAEARLIERLSPRDNLVAHPDGEGTPF